MVINATQYYSQASQPILNGRIRHNPSGCDQRQPDDIYLQPVYYLQPIYKEHLCKQEWCGAWHWGLQLPYRRYP